MAENQDNVMEQPGVSVPERVRQELHECEKICKEIKSLAQQEEVTARPQLAELKANYEAIKLQPEYAEIMDKEFAKSCEEFEQELELAKVTRERQANAKPLLEVATLKLKIISSGVHMLPHRLEIEGIAKEWRTVSEGVTGLEELTQEYQSLFERTNNRLAKELEIAALGKQQLEYLLAALKELQELPAEEFRKKRDSLEKRRNKALRNVDFSCKEVVSLNNSITSQFHELNAKLTRHYQALDLARWESYTLKLDICRELEKLKDTEEENLPKVATRLREIRTRWQELGAVPREKQNELGPKYYEYTNALQHRIDEYFKVLRKKRSEIATAKEALCVEAEALSTSTEWNATSDRLKALQQQWKELGNAGRDVDKVLYAKFRASCDIFFNARGAYWQERQQAQSAGAELKQQLCEAASKLGEMPVPEAIAEAKRLRSEFQKAPRAGKQESDLTAKFNAIMTAFFDGRRSAFDEARTQREALIDAVNALDTTSMVSEKSLYEFKEEWRNMPKVSREVAATLESKFKAAVANVEKSLSAVRQQQVKLRGELFIPALKEVAKVIEAARSGAEIPEIALDLTAFSRLGAIVTDIVAGGITPEMEKAIAANTKEFNSLLKDLESTADTSSNEVDLAAELTAAIMGNFGGNAFVNKGKEPRDIMKKLHATGMVEPAQLDELCSRYEKAKTN